MCTGSVVEPVKLCDQFKCTGSVVEPIKLCDQFKCALRFYDQRDRFCTNSVDS